MSEPYSQAELFEALCAVMEDAVLYGPGVLTLGAAGVVLSAAATRSRANGEPLRESALSLLGEARKKLTGDREPRGILG